VTDETSEILARRIRNAWNLLQKLAEDIHQLSNDDWDDLRKHRFEGDEKVEYEIRRVEDRAKLLRSRFEGKGRW
jgi:hypothetical protein